MDSITITGKKSLSTTPLPDLDEFPQVKVRPQAVTFIALMVILISLYAFISSFQGIQLLVHLSTIQPYNRYWSIGVIAMCVISLPLIVTGVFLFSHKEWARRGTMVLMVLLALSALLPHADHLKLSADRLFDFGARLGIYLILGCLPLIVLSWPEIKEYFRE